MRLNRYLASAGLGSRRSCEELISAGSVSINGKTIRNLATQVADGDDVRVHGRAVRPFAKTTVLFHKPRHFVTTRSDERGRRTIYDILPAEFSRLFHIGRLDRESEGLLLLTNDGVLARRLTHPSQGIEKEYEVELDKPFDPAHAAKLLRGFQIVGGRARIESLRQTGANRVRVVLKQGLKRQIRLMLYDRGYEVERLCRVRIGRLTDHRLPPGAWRHLTKKELDQLSGKPATA